MGLVLDGEKLWGEARSQTFVLCTEDERLEIEWGWLPVVRDLLDRLDKHNPRNPQRR